jgi:lipopolysaccharide export system permease protein
MFLLRKYIIKELIVHFVSAVSLLFIVSISNKFIDLLSRVASGKIPLFLVREIMLLSTPEILSLLMPLSLFIATLFVVSKLYAENKIVVIFSSGLGWSFLINTMIVIATIVAILTSICTLWAAPSCIAKRESIISKRQSIGVLSSIVPGQFQIINEGKQVFYVGDLDPNNNLKNIFIASTDDQKTDGLVITAKSGNIQSSNENVDDSLLILKQGNRYSGKTGSQNFSVVNFEEYGRQMLPKPKETSFAHKTKNTKELWYANNSEERAELEWRLAMPISTIILTLLAISLARVSPRQGRFAKFFPAILVYIIYCNLMIFMRRLVSVGCASNLLGIWLIHLLFLILSIFLLLHSTGWFLYFYKNHNIYQKN